MIRYENGLPLLIRTEEIIDYFKPTYYFIENPKGGKMKDFCYRPYVDVSYCRYGYDYRKDTRIWTNLHFLVFFPSRPDGVRDGYSQPRLVVTQRVQYPLVDGSRVRAVHRELRVECRRAVTTFHAAITEHGP